MFTPTMFTLMCTSPHLIIVIPFLYKIYQALSRIPCTASDRKLGVGPGYDDRKLGVGPGYEAIVIHSLFSYVHTPCTSLSSDGSIARKKGKTTHCSSSVRHTCSISSWRYRRCWPEPVCCSLQATASIRSSVKRAQRCRAFS